MTSSIHFYWTERKKKQRKRKTQKNWIKYINIRGDKNPANIIGLVYDYYFFNKEIITLNE